MLANLENSALATDWKRSVFIQIPKKGNAKECSNCNTIAFISHASMVTFKILQARFQQWRRQWHPTPVLLPRKSHGRRSLVGCSPWGLQRVGHDFTFTFMHWRRKWQTTPVFLPGESQGQRSLVGCRLWGHTESDMTEVT